SDSAFGEASGWFELFKANMEALWRYVPGRYGGGLTVFKAGDAAGGDLLSTLPTHLVKHVLAAQLSGTAYGWGALVSERPDVHSVPGDHYSMLAEPHVGVVAAQLQHVI